MAYRLPIAVASGGLQLSDQDLNQLVQNILRDGSNLIKQYAVQNLSGVPFQSRTGSHTINKRSGRGAASVQVQYPYNSPYQSRIWADARTRYANNPEEYNYLKVLEEGRGEIRPKYTSTARRGFVSRAALTIPGGPYNLVSGQNGFRGATGNYRFVRSIKPMAGKYWLEAAMAKAQPEIEEMATQYIADYLNGRNS
jgi:hypothetical protein